MPSGSAHRPRTTRRPSGSCRCSSRRGAAPPSRRRPPGRADRSARRGRWTARRTVCGSVEPSRAVCSAQRGSRKGARIVASWCALTSARRSRPTGALPRGRHEAGSRAGRPSASPRTRRRRTARPEPARAAAGHALRPARASTRQRNPCRGDCDLARQQVIGGRIDQHVPEEQEGLRSRPRRAVGEAANAVAESRLSGCRPGGRAGGPGAETANGLLVRVLRVGAGRSLSSCQLLRTTFSASVSAAFLKVS
jgi:hypothetical protein